MELIRKLSNKNTIKVEGATQKELFEAVAAQTEVFSIDTCGACNSDEVSYLVREAGEGKKLFKFYELVCRKCRAKLAFGQHSSGDTLFPKKKDDDGNWLSNNGWIVYKKENDAK